MRMAFPPFLAVALIISGTSADAQTLPYYDISGAIAACLKAKAKGGEPDDQTKAACGAKLTAELAARDKLVKNWNSYDPETRLICIAAYKGMGYYALQYCIEHGGSASSPL